MGRGKDVFFSKNGKKIMFCSDSLRSTAVVGALLSTDSQIQLNHEMV